MMHLSQIQTVWLSRERHLQGNTVLR